MSVVRLKIKFIKRDSDGDERARFGRGTGFIVLNNPRHMVIMTCGHSFENWEEGTSVEVTFHDRNKASAHVALLRMAQELTLLIVDVSGGGSAGPRLANAASYAPVAFSDADPAKGTVVVMLGYPISTAGDAEMGVFPGSVINETDTIKSGREDHIGLRLLSSDYPSGPGASGAPVFGVFGDDHRVVGFCKSGRNAIAYCVAMSCIRDTLKQALGGRPEHEKATLREILEFWLATVARTLRRSTGADPGAGSQGASGSGSARPSSSVHPGIRR